MIFDSLIPDVFAQGSSIVGSVTNPLPYGNLNPGITRFFSNVIRLIIMAASAYSLVNFIIAGYQYMSAGGDAKLLAAAWSRIWQTLLGLVFVVGSFALTALISYVIFGSPTFILNPKIYGPGP